MLFAAMLLSSLLFCDHDAYEYNEEERKSIHMPYDMHYLDLSSKQQKEIRHLLASSRERRKNLHKRTEALERSLSALFDQKYFDKQAFIERQLQLKKEALQIEADLLEGIHSILTEKQRKKFVHYLKEWEID